MGVKWQRGVGWAGLTILGPHWVPASTRPKSGRSSWAPGSTEAPLQVTSRLPRCTVESTGTACGTSALCSPPWHCSFPHRASLGRSGEHQAAQNCGWGRSAHSRSHQAPRAAGTAAPAWDTRRPDSSRGLWRRASRPVGSVRSSPRGCTGLPHAASSCGQGSRSRGTPGAGKARRDQPFPQRACGTRSPESGALERQAPPPFRKKARSWRRLQALNTRGNGCLRTGEGVGRAETTPANPCVSAVPPPQHSGAWLRSRWMRRHRLRDGQLSRGRTQKGKAAEEGPGPARQPRPRPPAPRPGEDTR